MKYLIILALTIVGCSKTQREQNVNPDIRKTLPLMKPIADGYYQTLVKHVDQESGVVCYAFVNNFTREGYQLSCVELK